MTARNRDRQHLSRAAVTGGTGFIGRELVAHLVKHGYSVKVLTRNTDKQNTFHLGVRLCKGDLADPQTQLDDFLKDIDVLYHCAGELKDEEKMTRLHINGTKRLTESARGRIRHWVQLSSVGVYGRQQRGVVHEDFPICPEGAYETTKAASDQIVLDAAAEGAFSTCILRPANVYGPGMPGKSLDKIIHAVNKGYFFYIGRPGATVNYIHVTDVADALMLCGQNPPETPKIYNLSDTRRIEESIQIIMDNLDKQGIIPRFPETIIRHACSFLSRFIPRFPLNKDRIDTLTSRVAYPHKKITDELGYHQQISLETGLKPYMTSNPT